MIRYFSCVSVLIVFLFSGHAARCEDSASSLAAQLTSKITQLLSEKIPNTRIKLPNLAHLASLSPLSEIASLQATRFIEDQASGIAVVEVVGLSEGGREIRQIVQTPYEAWVQVPTALKRVFPNTKLKTDDFKIQDINVASGMAREYRGVMIDAETDLGKMESRQTILEGQFVTRNAVQRQPDVRKGEMVKLELVSGDLSLVTQAIVQEPGSVGERIRVLTLKTKKEIVGQIKADHSIEVNL